MTVRRASEEEEEIDSAGPRLERRDWHSAICSERAERSLRIFSSGLMLGGGEEGAWGLIVTVSIFEPRCQQS